MGKAMMADRRSVEEVGPIVSQHRRYSVIQSDGNSLEIDIFREAITSSLITY